MGEVWHHLGGNYAFALKVFAALVSGKAECETVISQQVSCLKPLATDPVAGLAFLSKLIQSLSIQKFVLPPNSDPFLK